MKTVLLKLHKNETILVETIVLGQTHKVATKNKANYELVNEKTGYAPDHIVVKRVDDDLEVYISKDARVPDIVFESFYQMDNNGLLGLAEDDLYYYYIPDTAQINDYVTLLDNLSVQGHALGGKGFDAPWWMENVAGNASSSLHWLGGLGLLGGVAVVGAHRSHSKDDLPSVPAPKPNNQPTDLLLSDNHVAENQVGAVVGKLTTIDPDPSDTHSYIVSDIRFEVVNNELKLKDGIKVEFAQEKTIPLTITTIDKAGAKYSETVTLQVQDDPNYPAPILTPNGSVTIEGQAKVGQTLTAKISDADGISGSSKYQWLADGQPIQGATQSTYTLTANEKGKAISVQATYTDDAKVAENPSSAATAPVIEDTPAPPPPAADTTAPTLAISATPSTLTPGGSAQITFKASEPVKGFTADDVIVQGGTLSNFRQVDATTFTATFTAGAAGKASVTVTDDAFVDLANNPNELANLELVIVAAPTPQNHAPSDITLSADRLPENQAGAVVGKLTTVDEDQNDQHTYTVNDNRFEVDAQGNLKLKDGIKVEFAQEKTISLEITTTDKGGEKYSETFTLQVQDDPSYPAPNPPTPPNDGKLGVYVPKPATDFIANVKDAAYGAKGDGQTDDTAAIQKAIDAVAEKGGGIVEIPAGTYMVDAVNNRLHMKSHVILRLADDTVLKAITNGETHYDLIRFRNVDNAHIIGGTLEGDRETHTGTDGEAGHGIRLMAATNITIENVTLKNMWGDGIYLGKDSTHPTQNENVTVYQVTSDHNRRQGLSVTHGKNIKILNSIFQNTDGTDPRAGIDLEPNAGQDVSNVEIRGNQFLDNHIGFLVANNSAGSRVQNVVFENNTLSGNPRDAIILRGLEGGSIKGNTIHIDPDAHHHDSGGIRLYNGDYHAVKNPDPRPTRDVEITGNTLYGGTIMPRETSGNTIADNQFKAAVFIRGNAQNGEELTAQFYDGDGTSKAANVQYQWLADGVPINGATAARYTPSAADRGKTLTVKVSFIDNAGQKESAESDATPAVENVSNQAPTDITLSADRLPENQAGAVIGKLATVDPDAGDKHTYAVNDNRFEVDAQGNLKLKDGIKVEFAQEKTINLQITTTDKGGEKYSETITLQVQDDPAYPAPTPPNGMVRISGEAKVGGLLTAQVEDTDGFLPENIEYQWYAGGIPIPNAVEQTYQLTAAEKGFPITVRASYIDNADQDESPLSAETAPVADAGNGGKLGVYVPKPATDFVANVKDAAYGAKGDGQTDDTASIQKAIDAVAANGGGIVEIPTGTYMINGAATSVLGPGGVPRKSGLQVKSNVIIRMADDTVMQVIPNGEKHYDIFNIYNAENVAIMGGTLQGDRHGHLGNQGEWGSGIKIASGKNVVIENVIAREFWGDAVHITDSGSLPRTPSENVTVYQLTADGNRRQGISMTFADKVLVEDSVFKNTGGQGGTPPMSGIDIEPESHQQVSNVTIKNSTFDNNTGYGIILLERSDTTGADVRNIVIDGNTIKTGGAGIVVNNTGGHTITNNHISDIGKGWYYGSQHSLALNANSHDNTVTGNTVHTGSIIDAGRNNNVSGNTFESVAFVRGENKVGATLAAEVHNDDGAPRNISYQWLADGKPIDGATAATYTVRPQDAGKRISVEASFDKDGGARETTAYEVPTLPIEGVPNQAPTDITLSADRLPENQAGAVVGKLTTTDPDQGDSHTYAVNDQRFEVDAQGNLKLKDGVKVEFAQEKTINLQITTTDQGGEKYSETITLQVQDDPNYPDSNGGKLGVYVPKPATDFVVNAKDFGAKGDGQTDDRAAIQKAIDEVAAKGGGVVDIPGGTYMVDSVSNGGINVRSNVTVRMADDTIVKAIPNDQTSYAIFRVHNVENAHVLGGTLIGDRHDHRGSDGQGGYGVWVKASKDVVVENVTAKDFWGDGFLVSRYYFNEPSPENVVFYNVTTDNNRRQGMSITDGNNIRVIQSTFKNTYGTDPQSGIDIEPNPSAHSPMVDPSGKRVPGKVTNVEIIDSVFENNAGYGVIASANKDAVIENVRVINNRMDGNLNAITFNHVIGGEISGNTTLDNGRTIPYFDVDVYNNSQNIIVKDNTLYGGSVRSYEAGSLEGSGHQVSGNHTKAAVFIKGALKTGATVFAQPEDGNGVPLPKFIRYQWQIDGQDIAGATNREYTIRPEDSGKPLSVRVEFPDGSKVTETAVSKPTPPIDSFANNAAPTALELASKALEVIEGKNGAVAGRVYGTDRDRGDDLSYRISDERFDIDAYGLIRLKPDQKLDYAQTQSINVTVTATDRAGNELSKPFTIAVKDDPNYTAPAPTPPTNGGKLGVHVPKPATDFVANIKAYGAKGDGKADDTAAIQKAIDAAAEKGGGVVEMPGGTYMIDTTAQQGPHSLSRNYPSGLMMKPNVILKLADDTVLKAIPTDQDRHNLITFYKADNAHLIGGTLIGERGEHRGIEGQWGYGVRVISSKNVAIENVTAKDFWGDGFYVGINSEADPQSQNVTFYNVTADNNRRQGLSITDAKGVQVLDSVFKNTNGHMPLSGIDVEPNPGRSTTDIDIRGNRFEGNSGFGVVVSGSQFNRPGSPYRGTTTKNINIENNHFEGNRDGIWISGLEGGRVAGNTIRHGNYTVSPTGGIRKLRLDDMSRDIVVENNTLYGGGYPRGHTEHGKRIEGGGIENLGQNNTVRNNDYKADVFVRGLVKNGETLTAHVYDGDIVSADVRYQWLADGQPIDGATSRSYRLGDSDHGKRISVHVAFSDEAGEKESATSAETRPVGSPQPNHAPHWAYVVGKYIADETPGAVIGKIGVNDPDPGETFTYRISDERFEVVAGILKLKDNISIDDANEKSVSLALEVTDSGGASFVREITLPVKSVSQTLSHQDKTSADNLTVSAKNQNHVVIDPNVNPDELKQLFIIDDEKATNPPSQFDDDHQPLNLPAQYQPLFVANQHYANKLQLNNIINVDKDDDLTHLVANYHQPVQSGDTQTQVRHQTHGESGIAEGSVVMHGEQNVFLDKVLPLVYII